MGTARERALAEAGTLDLASADFLEREFEIWDLLRAELPVARTRQGAMGPTGASGWILSRYDDIADALRRPEDFSSEIGIYPMRPWIPQAIDPPAHTAYRRILNPWFTADEMAKLEPHLAQYAEELLEKMLAEDEEFDFVAGFADPFPTVIFCELCGFPAADYPQIMAWKNTLMHANDGHSRGRALAIERGRKLGLEVPDGGSMTAEQFLQVRASVGLEIYGYLKQLIEERRAKPADDLITRLIAARYEGERPLTQEELEDTLFLLFMAGLDTVASVLGLIVKGFAEDAGKRREFVARMEDPEKVASAIEELVRYHAIVTMPRRATRAIGFRSERFVENDLVGCPSPAANRDPEQFPRPHELLFDRSPNRHVGFGLGPHRCLGINLARRELRIGLQAFHRRLPDYRLHATRKPELFGGMKGVSSLWLTRG